MPDSADMERIEVGGDVFYVVKRYEAREILGRVEEQFQNEEDATAGIERIRSILVDLGKWEKLISVLRNLQAGVSGAEYDEPKSIGLEDLEFRSGRARMLPPEYGIAFDLAPAARSNTARVDRPWLWEAETWIAAFRNLNRWRALKESRGLLGL